MKFLRNTAKQVAVSFLICALFLPVTQSKANTVAAAEASGEPIIAGPSLSVVTNSTPVSLSVSSERFVDNCALGVRSTLLDLQAGTAIDLNQPADCFDLQFGAVSTQKYLAVEQGPDSYSATVVVHKNKVVFNNAPVLQEATSRAVAAIFAAALEYKKDEVIVAGGMVVSRGLQPSSASSARGKALDTDILRC